MIHEKLERIERELQECVHVLQAADVPPSIRVNVVTRALDSINDRLVDVGLTEINPPPAGEPSPITSLYTSISTVRNTVGRLLAAIDPGDC